MRSRSLVVAVLFLGACKSLGSDLPSEPPPLFDMEEPAAYLGEPDDESERSALELGGYTGVHVADAVFEEGSLDEDDLDDAPATGGVLVRKVTENSPGDAAGLRPDDILLSVVHRTAPPAGPAGERPLEYASDWRAVEGAAQPRDTLAVVFDRAGREMRTDVLVMPRSRPADRIQATRYSEQQRVGVILRTATEVEAAGAGLAPGGGAVIVGLSRASPWRQAGLVYGDLIVKIDGEDVAHPQVVLDAIRDAEEDATLEMSVRRGDQKQRAAVPLTRRARGTRNVSIPLLYSCGAERGETELSILGGALHRRTTRAAWEWRILWLISFSGGDADHLEESE